MAAAAKKEADPVNIVHQNAILIETIEKEHRHSKLYTQYSINPFKKLEGLAGKPNSVSDQGEPDINFIKIVRRAQLEPVYKYTMPQTAAQEIGWATKPLIQQDWNDPRLHFRRQTTDATIFQESLFKEKEQAGLNN